MSVLYMTLNYIWWWGFGSEALVNAEYLFIAIKQKSTLTRIGSNR